MPMKDVSILIPTYNGICTQLVSHLQRQAESLGMTYELIVADDGSTDAAAIAANRAIGQLPHCRYWERRENVGRAVIRNVLAREAKQEWLLFIDGDMEVGGDDFVRRYAEASPTDVIDGGIAVASSEARWRSNLRYRYETACAPQHTAIRRSLKPYRSFRTTNFMVRRSVMLAHPFDERFRHYGYEDVLFGKELASHGISISHIDNPVMLTDFESNSVFLDKTEESLRTLHDFRHELEGYSTLLNTTRKPLFQMLRPLIIVSHRLLASWERRQLTGTNPNLAVFKAYKTGYFCSL